MITIIIHAQQEEVFRQLFGEIRDLYVEDFRLSYEGVISDLKQSLTDLHMLNINIIHAFFGPAEARTILCEVRYI